MERAKDLLESSFLSVKEIAYQVGLNDESHFVRDFKATYGYSPSLYRSRFKNGEENEHSGSNGNNGSKAASVRQQVARAAKQSILPTLHLFVYIFSCY